MNAPIDSSALALAGLLSLALVIALYVWTALALSAMFKKMGDEPWKGWVPLLNVATILKWGGFSPWLVLLALVPFASIAVWILLVVSAHRINPGFGYGGGMTVLSALLFVVWASILGFGPARWLGARAPRRTGDAAPAARARGDAAPAVPQMPAGLAAAMGGSAAPASPVAPAAPVSSAPASPASLATPPAGAGDAASGAHAGAAHAGPVAGAPASFAPPPAAASDWTPPETTPRPWGPGVAGGAAASAPASRTDSEPAPADAPAAPAARPAPRDADVWGAAPTAPVPQIVTPPASYARSVSPDPTDDAAWPSEIDDVSAIHPSPFRPSSAAGRPFVAPPTGVSGESGPIAFVPGRRAGVPGVPDAPGTSVDTGDAGAAVTRVPAASSSPRPADAAASAPRPAEPRPAAAAPARAAAPQPQLAAEDPADLEHGGRAVEPDAPRPAGIYAPPMRSRRAALGEDDAFPEMSGEVSAVIGSPTAGAPRSAGGAVSAQHRRVETGESDPDGFDDDLDQTVIARRAVKPTWELVPAAGSPIPLTAAVVILGRRPSGDAAFPSAQLVAVPDEARTVSKTHARIELRGDAWIVTDLGSTNGVLVRTLMGDEVEVDPGSQLDAGERFFLGDEEFHLRRILP